MSNEIVPIPPGPVVRVGDRQPPSSIRQFSWTVFKWRRLAVALAVVFAVAATLALVVRPAAYQARAKLLLKSDRTPMNISGLTPPSGRQPYSAQIVHSEVQLFKSREVLEPVARKLAAGRPDANVEELIASVGNRIVPTAIPDTNVIQVLYTASTPDDAQKGLALVIDEYMTQHAEAYSGSARLLKFYELERERVATELGRREDELKRFQEAEQVVAVDGQIASGIAILGDLERALQQAEAEREATAAKIDVIKGQAAQQPARVVTSDERVANPLIAKLKTDLSTAEVALGDVLQRYTDEDRRVAEKREQIATIKRELAAAEREGEIGGKRTVAVNALRSELERELATSQARLTTLGAHADVVRGQVKAARADLARLREKKTRVVQLTRAVDAQHDAFMAYGKRLEEARIAAGLDREQLANVAVIERPHSLVPPSETVAKAGMVGLAALLGIVVALGIAFGAEFFTNALRTREDVEYHLGLPVIAVIPADPRRALPGGRD